MSALKLPLVPNQPNMLMGLLDQRSVGVMNHGQCRAKKLRQRPTRTREVTVCCFRNIERLNELRAQVRSFLQIEEDLPVPAIVQGQLIYSG